MQGNGQRTNAAFGGVARCSSCCFWVSNSEISANKLWPNSAGGRKKIGMPSTEVPQSEVGGNKHTDGLQDVGLPLVDDPHGTVQRVIHGRARGD